MCIPYLHTWCGRSANLRRKSETCCTRLAANTGRNAKSRQKIAVYGYHLTTLSGYIFATKAHIDNRKNLLSSNISSTYSHNMVNFGTIAAEIAPAVWGTPADFNGFRVLAALLYGTPWRLPNFAALNSGRHLYSAGRPSRWVLAHIIHRVS